MFTEMDSDGSNMVSVDELKAIGFQSTVQRLEVFVKPKSQHIFTAETATCLATWRLGCRPAFSTGGPVSPVCSPNTQVHSGRQSGLHLLLRTLLSIGWQWIIKKDC